MSVVGDLVAPLFVPANRRERFEKAALSGADAIILDLEDAVPADAKSAARANMTTAFTALPVLLRINAFGTPWHDADVDAMRQHAFAAIMVPKAEPGDALAALAAKTPHPVVALIESARGLAGARLIAQMPSVSRLAFGSIDYCADIGCYHTREALLAARSELVLASRIGGLPAPIDGVTASIDDGDQAEQDARYAAGLGFGGKSAIHPRQVAPILAGFAPSEHDVEWATRVLQSGAGAVAVDGAMVDEPVRARARHILKRSSGNGSVPIVDA